MPQHRSGIQHRLPNAPLDSGLREKDVMALRGHGRIGKSGSDILCAACPGHLFCTGHF